ncbi:MAG TPA: Fe-S cluster assembly protein SufD [Phycisphaerales bacterium]|nr:Fe-S cluster assembly protein SufD [Phycisphaerales bacterium]
MCTDTIETCPLCDAIEKLSERSMSEQRREACHRMHAIGWPNRKLEAWRYCNLKDIASTRWHPAPPAALSQADLDDFAIDGTAARLVFVNGRFDPTHSSPLPDGVRLLGPLIDETPLDVDTPFADDYFAAMSTALIEDGVIIDVPAGVVLPGSIHVMHITEGGCDPIATTLRILIRVGCGARLGVIETWAGHGTALTTPMTEAHLDEDARLDHARLIEESDETTHLGTIASRQAAGSTFESAILSVGGRIARTRVHASLDGEGAHAAIRGLGMGTDSRHIDNALHVMHASPACTSREYFKNLLAGDSTAAFTGRIHVAHGAQQTDAVQTNRNLLLSPTAKSWARPQLEIYADDVKCTHGATTGEIEAEALFYLLARGIPEATARSLLAWAFVAEVVDEVPLPALRKHMARRMLSMLPGAERLDESVVSM